MAKLSEAMIRGLRLISEGRSGVVPIRTCEALRSRFMVKPGAKTDTYEITPTGADVLARLDRAEREAKEATERKARPVPASAFVEPSAKNAPALGLEYDEDETDEDETDVPQAWIDQLVTLLDADYRITLQCGKWGAGSTHPAPPVTFTLSPDRLHLAAEEAIRRGIAQALPPTPGQSVVRLALWKHSYGHSHSGMLCGAMVLRRDAAGEPYGDECGLPAAHSVHKVN